MRTADPLLHAVLRGWPTMKWPRSPTRARSPRSVRETIELELERGAALEAVAARMHLSPSALRSRLRQHGTTYSAMLDRLRRDYAKRALRQSQLSVAEIAHRLGFAHPPAFHRAFRRWFGVTPNAYREAPSGHPATRFWHRPAGEPRHAAVEQ